MVLVVVAHRSPRLWGDTIVTTTTIGRRVTITINHYHHHYHDHPISILIAVPPTQEGRTSTGWTFPLKSFWLRSPAPRQSSPWHLKINGATPNVKFSFSQLLAQVPENAWRNGHNRWCSVVEYGCSSIRKRLEEEPLALLGTAVGVQGWKLSYQHCRSRLTLSWLRRKIRRVTAFWLR